MKLEEGADWFVLHPDWAVTITDVCCNSAHIMNKDVLCHVTYAHNHSELLLACHTTVAGMSAYPG